MLFHCVECFRSFYLNKTFDIFWVYFSEVIVIVMILWSILLSLNLSVDLAMLLGLLLLGMMSITQQKVYLLALLLIFLQDSKLSRYGGIKGRLYITDSGKFPNCVGPPAFPPQNQRDPLPFINFQIGKNKKYLTT